MSEHLYGQMTKAELIAQYGAISLEQFAKVCNRAVRATHVGASPARKQQSATECVVLVEDLGDGYVDVLPWDAAPHPWRTFWQRRSPDT